MSSQHKLPGHIQFWLYAAVGGSGFVVNMVTLYVINTLVADVWGKASAEHILAPLPWTDFNLRVYHVFIAISFLVANLSNYWLNKRFTFSHKDPSLARTRYMPFLITGIIGLIVTALVTTSLMNPTSPFYLPDSIFNGTSTIRNKLYWANATGILISTPVTFLVNKYWTFTHRPKAPRG